MYGGPVPAIAELIANAWDADAHTVELTIPLGKSPSAEDTIEIKDFGRGMSWEEVAHDYLVIGRNRRHGGPDVTKLGRSIMGRKGIGKLAGFGIARVVEVRTVRQQWLTHFAMDYDDMTSDTAAHARYEPRIIADQETREKNSTTIILRHLSLKRAIPEQQFYDSLARRFAVLSSSFVVKINGNQLLKSEMPLAFRNPAKSGAMVEATVEGLGPIRYWYGFTKDTIKDDDARGMGIYVRGRLAQVPGIFNLSQGLWNQQDIQYFTGEVYADELDDDEDYISTNRQTINWKEGRAASLEAWGQELVKRALRDYDLWKSREERSELLAPLGPAAVKEAEARLNKLPQRASHVASRLLSTYKELATKSKSETALATAVKDVFTLAELSVVPKAQRTIPALVEARKRILRQVPATPTVTECAKIIRENPWILFSPWRIVLIDRNNAGAVRGAKSELATLSGVPMFVVRHENRRYLVAVGDAGLQLERALQKTADKLNQRLNIKLSDIYLVETSDSDRGGTDAVKVKSIQRLLKHSMLSCDSLLKLLEEESQLAR